jgi:FSR family fosmidomycin resistance protein-like MFS transporter
VAKAGFIAALCATLGEGMQLIFGPLADMGRRRSLILLGIGLTAAGALLAHVSHYLGMASLLVLTYIGSAAFHPSGSSLAFGLAPKRRGLVYGVFAAAGAFGLALSQLVYAAVYSHFEGQTLLLALPILLLVLGALWVPLPESQQQRPKARPGLRQLTELFQNRHLRELYVSQVLNQAFYWAVIFLLPDLLQALGFDSWLVRGGGHFVMVMGMALMTVPMGWLLDRFGARAVLLYGQCGAGLAMTLILTIPSLPTAVTLALLFFLGACAGSFSPVGVVMGNRLHPGCPGRISAFLMGFVWIFSEGIGPGTAGVLASLFSDAAVAKALAVMTSLLLGSFALTSRLPNDALIEDFVESQSAA